MIVLDATTEILELTTSAAVSTDYYVAWADITSTTLVIGESDGNVNTATTTTIVAAPAASTQRQVKYISIRNRSSTSSQTVTVKFDVSGTERYLTGDITLAAGEVFQYNCDTGWVVKDRAGRDKVQNVDVVGYTGFPLEIYKVGTAAEAAGQWYGWAKDNGFPGAWVPGAPGVNGWWTDASTATNAANPAGATQTGSPNLTNPASGAYYLQKPQITTSVGSVVYLVDLLWYNTGLTVTTTTAQAITMPGASVPARDLYGTTNGEGWQAGVYVTTATTNAGAITNMTLNYTNSEGTNARTGTVPSFPATAVIGTFVPFALQAGDRGIRTIEGITLGTSLVTGAISLCLYRTLYVVGNTVVNLATVGQGNVTDPTGIRIYDGTALWWLNRASATTATTLAGNVSVIER